MQDLVTCLTFKSDPTEAVHYYCSLFKDSRILQVTHYGEEELKELSRLPPEQRPGPALAVKTITFELMGRRFVALNGGGFFEFNHGVSLMVKCHTQDEIDYLWQSLSSDGGKVEECGWLKDRYGLSWQIVPYQMDQWMDDANPDVSQQVSRAIYHMKKLDVQALQSAAEHSSSRSDYAR